MKKVSEISVMTLLGMLEFLVLIIVYHLLLIFAKIFLVLGAGDTFGINRNFGAKEKKFYINFDKEKTKFYLSLH